MPKKNQSSSQLPYVLMGATIALGSGAAYFVAATPEKAPATAAASRLQEAAPSLEVVVAPPQQSGAASVAASQPALNSVPSAQASAPHTSVIPSRQAEAASSPTILARLATTVAPATPSSVSPSPVARPPLTQQGQKALARPSPALGQVAPPLAATLPLPAVSPPPLVEKESPMPPRPILAEPLVRRVAAPIVLTANQDRAWVRVDETSTAVIVRGQSVEGLGTYHGIEGGAAKFDKGSFNVSP